MNELKVGFSAYTNTALVERAEKIHEALTSETGLEYFPAPDPSMTVIKAAYEILDKQIAKETCPSVAALRQHYREILDEHLVRLAPYIELTANGDMVKLKDCGYELRKTTRHRSTEDLPAPENVKASHTGYPGEAALKCKRVKGASSYLAEAILEEDGTVTRLPVSTACQKFRFTGLLRGKSYLFHTQAYGPNGPSPWSQSVSMMIV